MSSKTFRTSALVALALTLGLIYSYPHLPEKRRSLIPAEAVRFLYSDVSPDGGNGITWVDENEDHYKCFKTSEQPMRFCGINIILQSRPEWGYDLSQFRQINLNFNYQGPATVLRLFFRHYDARYAVPDDPNSAKFISALIDTHELDGTLTIPFQELRVADWWLYQHDIPRHLTHAEFNNITTLGIDFGGDIPMGEHFFDIESIAAVGPWIQEKDWYLGILAVWITGIAALVVQQWVVLYHRARLDQERIRNLASRNISLHHQTEEYKQLSTTDALTGVANRRGIEQTIQALMHRSASDRVSFILLDLDHFKQVNDTLGHEVGDEILKQVATLLVSSTRSIDHVGRWGGEEFTVLCARTDIDSGYALAEKLRQHIASHCFRVNGKPLKITASFSVVSLTANEDFSDAFRRADTALYEAKQAGRNFTIKADEQQQSLLG